ncbi:uncharacterized protein B0I36DRAFT_392793 [Microdochium trichocladiopsis]|uniref:WSC domain-containing protein n=1 Tax=Microdochium trichocladiopsis TaxID=1682393 RepID=A0A9P8XV30_9PEZI|nr:uncharacterized protein B0I36DRAFT_392793 [Microdochium trichocladiopsis]KAH7020704.1 hypothetical protein B0I36DRAFT_392793 [Microdochium trichocladiopsis]
MSRQPQHGAPTSSSLGLLLAAVLYAHLASAASITNGPLAPVTVAVSNMAYSTARECARYCLEYGGIWHCGYNAGYYGLGSGLGCGCASTNGCFCNAAYATSATSYLSSCISAGCGRVVGTGWTSELNAMLGIYDAYCSTANVEQEVVSWTPTATATGAGAGGANGGSATTAAVTGTRPTNTAASATSNPSTGETGNNGNGDKGSGLSQSDIVALAASLGVGIPSLLIAGITLCVQLRKKKRRAGERESAMVTGGYGYDGSSFETTTVGHVGVQQVRK